MQLSDWIPALTTTGLGGVALALVLWLARTAIMTWLTKIMGYDFDARLERFRSEVRRSEEELSGLRSGALNAMASTQSAIDKRRLDAVDELWSAVLALRPAQTISVWLSVLNSERLAKETESNPNAQKLVEALGGGFSLEKLDLGRADAGRPFLTPTVWAAYAALKSFAMLPIVRWHQMKSGLPDAALHMTADLNNLLRSVLPEWKEEVKADNFGNYQRLLEALETKVLNELRAMLNGAEVDEARVKQAQHIIETANHINMTTSAQASSQP